MAAKDMPVDEGLRLEEPESIRDITPDVAGVEGTLIQKFPTTSLRLVAQEAANSVADSVAEEVLEEYIDDFYGTLLNLWLQSWSDQEWRGAPTSASMSAVTRVLRAHKQEAAVLEMGGHGQGRRTQTLLQVKTGLQGSKESKTPWRRLPAPG
eukprot:893797-Amphidinium_carterae.1